MRWSWTSDHCSHRSTRSRPAPSDMSAPQSGGGVITLSAAKYAALRQSLAAAILKARTEAAEEASLWRAQAEAARAETETLRETLARDLALERGAPLSLPAAVEAVGSACRAIEDAGAGADARHASFLRQGAVQEWHAVCIGADTGCAARIVQTVREVCGGSTAKAATLITAGPGRAPARDVAGFLIQLLTSMVRARRGPARAPQHSKARKSGLTWRDATGRRDAAKARACL